MSWHDVFGAALELFGKVWPAVGLVFCVLGVVLVALMLMALWEACTGPCAGWVEDGESEDYDQEGRE
jgi:hypothetical protein